MKQIIGGIRYDTEKATEVANDCFSHSSGNRLNTGRATHLYKSPKERYFAYHETIWQGEHDSIEPLSKEEAKSLIEALPNHSVSYEEAFGDEPEEA